MATRVLHQEMSADIADVMGRHASPQGMRTPEQTAAGTPGTHAPLAVRDLLRLYGTPGPDAKPRSATELEALTQQARRDAHAHRSSAWLAALLQEVDAIQADDLQDFVEQLAVVLSRDNRATMIGVILLLLGMACMSMSVVA